MSEKPPNNRTLENMGIKDLKSPKMTRLAPLVKSGRKAWKPEARRKDHLEEKMTLRKGVCPERMC